MSVLTISSPLLIWQIFRKDFKLLWPLAAALMVCQLALLLLTGSPEPIELPGVSPVLAAALLRLVIVSGSALLILLSVQQDPLPGVGQDWLARPLRRSDLFLAKLLFALLMIHAPLLVTGVLQGLWQGFPLGASLLAALSHNLGLLLLLSLPVLTIAALTRHLTEAVFGSVLVAIAGIVTLLLVGMLVMRITHGTQFNTVTFGTGIGWVWATLSLAVLVTTMAAVLTLLYAQRKVQAARVVFCAGLALCTLVLFLPFSPAFALQVWLSPPSGVQRNVSVVFDPARTAPPAAVRVAGPWAPDEVMLPLHLSYAGVPAVSVLSVDHSQVRVLDEGGRTLFRGQDAGNPFPSAAASGSLAREEQLIVPLETYRQLRDRPVRLEIDQFMTLLRMRTEPPLPVAGGDQQLLGVGRCTTRVDRIGHFIEAGCRAAGELPACMSIQLALPSGAHNPPWFQCSPNYAPWRTHLSLQAVSQFVATLPFFDPTGQDRYPVDESRLREAHVVFIVYEPFDHFVGHVQAASVRLRDFAVALRVQLSPAPAQAPVPAAGD